MAAYHREALRRQRVIDRQIEALNRIESTEAKILHEEFTKSRAPEEAAKLNAEQEDEMNDLQQQKVGRKPIAHDLRYQRKILRDHGLVMGHVNEQFLS